MQSLIRVAECIQTTTAPWKSEVRIYICVTNGGEHITRDEVK